MSKPEAMRLTWLDVTCPNTSAAIERGRLFGYQSQQGHKPQL